LLDTEFTPQRSNHRDIGDPTSSSLLSFNSTDNHQQTSEALQNEILNEILSEQQETWQDATTDETDDVLEPNDPVDNAMLCDIQKYASRLTRKLINS